MLQVARTLHNARQQRENVVGVVNLSLRSRVTNRKGPPILVGRDRPLRHRFIRKQNFSSVYWLSERNGMEL
ncbi:hypothetical protein PO909_024013 [Leuciscus waleckii]